MTNVTIEQKHDWVIVKEDGIKKGSWSLLADDYAWTEARKLAGQLRRSIKAKGQTP